MSGGAFRATALAALSAGLVFFTVACSILPSGQYREARSFDIGVPPSANAGVSVSVQPFGSDSACKFKMIYRSGGNEMLVDEYNRWTQPPGQMITKYLHLAFRDAPGTQASWPLPAKYELSGSVLAFEADFDAKQANLGVRYVLRSKERQERKIERTAVFSEHIAGMDSADVAKAMTHAAAKLVDSIKSDLQALESAERESVKAAAVK